MTEFINRISNRKKSKKNFILVPLIEEFMDSPVDLNNDERTQDFFADLLESHGKERLKNVMSPSSIGDCKRRQYFKVVDKPSKNVFDLTSYGYFLDGHFRHLKWQYVLYRMQFAFGDDFKLIGVELPMINRSGSVAGTCDAIVRIKDEHFIVDFKGMNTYSWKMFNESEYSHLKYNLQITAYGILANEKYKGEFEIKSGLIIGEQKSGPVSGTNDLGLHERSVSIKSHGAEVVNTIKTVRGHVKKKTKPPLTCTTVDQTEFKKCPYSELCKEEIKALS